MNTMDQHRRGLAPNKRKDRDFQKPSKFIKPSAHRAVAEKPSASKTQILAGYLAYEFLKQGTLFGKPWEQIKPVVADEPRQVQRNERYVEAASLLKTDGGLQIPGVVNPTQLTQFLQP